jgi:hypothetical protein
MDGLQAAVPRGVEGCSCSTSFYNNNFEVWSMAQAAGQKPGAVRVRPYFTGLGPSDGGRSLGRVHLRRIGRA